jgi:hypothetical protein
MFSLADSDVIPRRSENFQRQERPAVFSFACSEAFQRSLSSLPSAVSRDANGSSDLTFFPRVFFVRGWLPSENSWALYQANSQVVLNATRDPKSEMSGTMEVRLLGG